MQRQQDQGTAQAGEVAGPGLVSRALNKMLETVLFLVAGLVIVAAAGPLAGLWHYEVIQTGSMTPALGVGGVAIVVPEPVRDVRVGQVLAFHPPGMPKYARIHRVVALTHRGGQLWIKTKGDANLSADPGPVRLEGNTAYVERAFVPYFGYAGIWLYQRWVRTALEVALFALMVSGGLWLIWSGENEGEGSTPEVARPGRRWPLTVLRGRTAAAHAAPGPHVVAEKAAAATMVALNQMYAAETEGGDTSTAPEQARRPRARTGQ